MHWSFAVWASPTVDAKRGLLYVSTSNGYTFPSADTTNSVMALDLGSGKRIWTRQLTPNDAYIVGCGPTTKNENCPQELGPDFAVGSSPMLVSLADGKDMIVVGQKSGLAWGLDPAGGGAIRWQYRVGQGSTLGGIEWGGAVEGETVFYPNADARYGLERAGGLSAINIATGARVWFSRPRPTCAEPNCVPALSAAATAIPGVVFSGGTDGWLRAFDTRDGSMLWEYQTARLHHGQRRAGQGRLDQRSRSDGRQRHGLRELRLRVPRLGHARQRPACVFGSRPVMRKPMWCACWVLATGLVFAQPDFPKPAGRVNDFAGILNASTKGELDGLLDDLERKTSAEVAVAVVPSLGGMPVEEYANRLFKEWGIGQAKQDNGVLVLVAPNEREMRIEVGYGLEGVLPDGLAGEIIRDQFLPRFRDNDYPGGIRDGVRRVAEIVERHQVLTPDELARFNQSSDEVPVFILIPLLGLFVAIGFFMIGAGLRIKTGFPLLFGSLFGGLPLLASLGIVFTTALFTLVPLAMAMAVWGYRMGFRPSVRHAFRPPRAGGGTGTGGSGWVMGGGSSSGSGSSSSSSSGGSFGGGSSGGGGASGKW